MELRDHPSYLRNSLLILLATVAGFVLPFATLDYLGDYPLLQIIAISCSLLSMTIGMACSFFFSVFLKCASCGIIWDSGVVIDDDCEE